MQSWAGWHSSVLPAARDLTLTCAWVFGSVRHSLFIIHNSSFLPAASAAPLTLGAQIQPKACGIWAKSERKKNRKLVSETAYHGSRIFRSPTRIIRSCANNSNASIDEPPHGPGEGGRRLGAVARRRLILPASLLVRCLALRQEAAGLGSQFLGGRACRELHRKQPCAGSEYRCPQTRA